MVEVEQESEPKDDEIVEAAIRKIENDKKRLENGQTQPAPKKSAKEPTKSTAPAAVPKKSAPTPNSKKPAPTYSKTHNDRKNQKSNKKN